MEEATGAEAAATPAARADGAQAPEAITPQAGDRSLPKEAVKPVDGAEAHPASEGIDAENIFVLKKNLAIADKSEGCGWGDVQFWPKPMLACWPKPLRYLFLCLRRCLTSCPQ